MDRVCTLIGSEMVAKAPPDGYTLLVSPGTLAINPARYRKMPYDALRDFAPITHTLEWAKVAKFAGIQPE